MTPTPMPAAHVLDAWYAAAHTEAVGRAPLRCNVFDQAIALYRTEAGAPVALQDRCAHRFAPLSMGSVCGDALACPYHGMQYGPDGRCIRVPGQTRIPPGAVVRSYPTLERYGLVFVWMGDPEQAEPSRLVEVERYGAPGWGLSRGYTLFNARMSNITDNLVDPAHTSFVHGRTIGNNAGDDVAVTAQELGEDTVVCGRWVNDAPAVPIVQRFAQPVGHVDRWQFYYLKAPCTSWVDFGAQLTGRPHTPLEQDAAPYRVLSYAFLTPRDAHSTHYFSFQLRNFGADDDAVTAEFNALYKATFDEDRVLLEAIERAEQAEPALQPLRIASDTGIVRLRRLMERLRARETAWSQR